MERSDVLGRYVRSSLCHIHIAKERDALDGLFAFTDDDKQEFFRTQRERIHAGRRVDTTDDMRLIQTSLRD